MQQNSTRQLPRVDTIRCFSVLFRQANDIKYLVPIDVVTDHDESGQIIGVEILSAEFHAKKNLFAGYNWEAINNATGMRFSFDKSSDAFYLSILPGGRSVDQKVHPGRLILDSGNELVSIEIILSDD